jgi:hypothetical protein
MNIGNVQLFYYFCRWRSFICSRSKILTVQSMLNDIEEYSNILHYISYQIILDKCGISYTWQNQFSMLIDCNIIKLRILDIYHQSWYCSYNNYRLLDTYRFESYSYVTKYFGLCLQNFARLTRLEYWKGKINNKPRHDWICSNYSSRQIETSYTVSLLVHNTVKLVLSDREREKSKRVA